MSRFSKAALALATVLLLSCEPAKSEIQEKSADLVIYSSHPADLATTIVDEFRERTGLRVRIVSEGTGALLSRLRREDGSGADVFWGGGAESLVANIDLFAAYRSPEREAIPPGLRDEEGFWTGFTVLPMVIIANKRLVPDGAIPRRWSDLARASLAGSVAYATPVSSGSAYTILRTMLVAGGAAVAGGTAGAGGPSSEEAAWRLIEDFVAAIGGEPLEESSLVYRGVSSGEFLTGATFENAGADAQRLGSDVVIIYPEDGTSAVPDGVAILKGAPHPENSRRFVDFALGLDVARVVAARFKRRSARSDAPVPAGLQALESIKLLDYDFDAAVSEREETIARFNDLTEQY